LLNYKNRGHFPACACICSQIKGDDKRKSPQSTNPGKREEQTLSKSINHSAAKYLSLPGTEGARLNPRVSPRAESHQKKLQERMQTARGPTS
jgi:hypothetical protein